MSIPGTQYTGDYEALGKVTSPDPAQVTRTVGPVEATSTPAYVAVPGSQIDTAGTLLGNVSYVVEEVGTVYAIAVEIQGSLNGNSWFVIPLSGTTSIIASGNLTINAGPIPSLGYSLGAEGVAESAYRYYQIAISDASSGSHGVARVTGYAA